MYTSFVGAYTRVAMLHRLGACVQLFLDGSGISTQVWMFQGKCCTRCCYPVLPATFTVHVRPLWGAILRTGFRGYMTALPYTTEGSNSGGQHFRCVAMLLSGILWCGTSSMRFTLCLSGIGMWRGNMVIPLCAAWCVPFAAAESHFKPLWMVQ